MKVKMLVVSVLLAISLAGCGDVKKVHYTNPSWGDKQSTLKFQVGDLLGISSAIQNVSK